MECQNLFSVKSKKNISICRLLNIYPACYALRCPNTYGNASTLEIANVITKTCQYNFDPFKSLFYIVKLGFTGVYIIFLISVQNIDCGYSLEPPRRGNWNR